MGHYILTVVRDTNFRNNKLRQLIAKHKLRHDTEADAEAAAAAISQVGDVQRIAITLVHETHRSMWRKGKKS